MANTTIAIKKSGTPSAVPGALANGELAINYADGKLYYKNATGQIASISGTGGNSFGIANVDNVLILSSTGNDVLNFRSGNGISLSACSTTRTITFNSTGTSTTIPVSAVAPNSPTANSLWWNSNLGRLFIYYNDGDSSQWIEATASGGSSSSSGGDPSAAFDKANSANVLAFNTGIGANAWANSLSTIDRAIANTAGNSANAYADATFYTIANGSASFMMANIAGAQANNISVDTEMRGFLNQTDTYLRFDTTSNTFTLANTTSAGWQYWVDGRRYSIAGNSSVVVAPSGASNGSYYITIQNNGTGALTASNTVWDLTDPATITVAYVKYNANANPRYFIAEERHTVLMDARTHRYLHFTRGTQAQQFGQLTGYTVEGNANANNIFAISTTILNDEDIILTIPAKTPAVGNANNYFVFHRYAANSWTWIQNEMPYKYTTGGFIEYDNNATMTQAANNTYVNSYLLFTNLDQGAGFAIIPGRATYANLTSAQAEDATAFDMTGFGVLESVVAYQLTWHTDSTMTTAGKVHLADTPRRIGAAVASVTPVYTSGLHNDLGGLQGGDFGEYYHLTSLEYANLQSGKAANDAANSANNWANTKVANTSTTVFLGTSNNTNYVAGANAAEVLSTGIEFVIDGGGSAITTGQKGHLEIPFSGVIGQWTMLLDQTGSANVEIWKDTYANFPPTNADTINTGGFTVSAGVKNQGSLFNVTSTINAGDILAYNVATVSTATRLTISLKVAKT